MSSVYTNQTTLKLHGNKMSVPPIKSTENATEKNGKTEPTIRPASKSDSGSSTKSQDSTEKRDIKDSLAKEKQLNQKIANLNKVIEDLKKQLRQKEKIIENMNEQLKLQEEDYKKKLLNETHSHIQTKCSLDQRTEQLNKVQAQLRSAREECERRVKEIEEKMAAEVSGVKREKEKEIFIRDEKLRTLKKQMAEVLFGNSRERQQQLEELTKELSRVQEEADVLRFKLKSYRLKQQDSCPGCKDMGEELTRTRALTHDQDDTIKELQILCAKLELQLTQQDELLKEWAESEAQKQS